jgi:hypothetical protein
MLASRAALLAVRPSYFVDDPLSNRNLDLDLFFLFHLLGCFLNSAGFFDFQERERLLDLRPIEADRPMSKAKERNALVAHHFVDRARRLQTEPLSQLLLIEKAIFFFHSPATIARGKHASLRRPEEIGQLLGNEKGAMTQKAPKNTPDASFWTPFRL